MTTPPAASRRLYWHALLVAFAATRGTLAQSPPCSAGAFAATSSTCMVCPPNSYSYGGTTSCADCPPGTSLVSASTGCWPSSSAAGPTNGLAFYLSGTSDEGVEAFTTITNHAGVSFAASVSGAAKGSLVLANCTYLAFESSSASTSLPTGNSSWSLCSWVKCLSTGGEEVVLAWGGAAGANSSTFAASLTVGPVGVVFELPGPLPACDGTWHHIALTYVGTLEPALTAYVDGVVGAVAEDLIFDLPPFCSSLSVYGAVPMSAVVDTQNLVYDFQPPSCLATSSTVLSASTDCRALSTASLSSPSLCSYDVDQNHPGSLGPYSFSVTFAFPAVLTSFVVVGDNDGDHNIGSAIIYDFEGGTQISSSSSVTDAIVTAVIGSLDAYSTVFVKIVRSADWQGIFSQFIAYGSYSVAATALERVPSLRIGWSGNAGSLFAGALSDLRIYNRTLLLTEVVAISQPPLPSYPNAVVSPPVPTAGATSYTWTCLAGFVGPSMTLSKSSTDGTWLTSGGPVACLSCPSNSYSFGGTAACSPCAASATLVSSSTSCVPSAILSSGPTDTAFFLSGSSSEGISALSSYIAPLPVARYVHLTTPASFAGELTFADVDVLGADGVTNLALRSSSSGTYPVATSSCLTFSPLTSPNYALDDIHTTYFQARNTSSITSQNCAPSVNWWEVDLGSPLAISGVRFWPREDAFAASAASASITLLVASSRSTVWLWSLPATIASSAALTFTSNTTPSFVAGFDSTPGSALRLAGGTSLSVASTSVPPSIATGNAAFSASAWVKCTPCPGNVVALGWGANTAAAPVSLTNTASLSLSAFVGGSFPLTSMSISSLPIGFGAGVSFSGNLAGLAVDSACRVLYVLDRGARQVFSVNLTTMVATVFCGLTSGTSTIGISACASATFGSPSGIALDAARGLLYIADGAFTVRRIVISTRMVSTLGMIPNSGAGPLSIVVDPGSGDVIVADTADAWLFRLSAASGAWTQLAPLWTFSSPAGLVVDTTSGSILVADAGSNQVVQLSNSSGDAIGVLALPSLNSPQALAIDGRGRLVVADTGNGQVQRLSASAVTGAVSTLFSGVSSPCAIAVDAITGSTYFLTGCSATAGTSSASSVMVASAVVNPLPLCDFSWHHVAIVKGGGGQADLLTLVAFVDGVAVAAGEAFFSTGSAGGLVIGQSASACSDVELQQLRVYSRPLSAAEVQALASVNASAAAANLTSLSNTTTSVIRPSPNATSLSASPAAVVEQSCSAASASIPASSGLLFLPAAASGAGVDLIVADNATCVARAAAGASVRQCNVTGPSLLAADNMTTLFVIGTAASLNMRAAEQLMCVAATPMSGLAIVPGGAGSVEVANAQVTASAVVTATLTLAAGDVAFACASSAFATRIIPGVGFSILVQLPCGTPQTFAWAVESL